MHAYAIIKSNPYKHMREIITPYDGYLGFIQSNWLLAINTPEPSIIPEVLDNYVFASVWDIWI